jgi:tetratricopeptide (TPR) repeat protein
LKVYPENVDAL